MWIDIDRLRKEPVVYDVELSPEFLRGDIEEDLRFDPGRGTVTFRMVRGEVMGTGELTTTVYSHCGRCLGPVVRPVQVKVEIFYWPHTEDHRAEETDSEAELDLDTPDVGFYEAGGFDPDDELRQLLVVEVPTVLVCSSDCRGLCPQCGANRNEGDCGCAARLDETEEKPEEAPAAETEPPWKKQLRGLSGKIGSK